MKKLLAIFCIVFISMSTFAEEAASCYFRSNSSAYVTASVECTKTGNCNYTGANFTITIRSYGEKEGSVIVTIQYSSPSTGKEERLTKVVTITNGKGSDSVTGPCISSSRNFKVTVSNAVCH